MVTARCLVNWLPMGCGFGLRGCTVYRVQHAPRAPLPYWFLPRRSTHSSTAPRCALQVTLLRTLHGSQNHTCAAQVTPDPRGVRAAACRTLYATPCTRLFCISHWHSSRVRWLRLAIPVLAHTPGYDIPAVSCHYNAHTSHRAFADVADAAQVLWDTKRHAPAALYSNNAPARFRSLRGGTAVDVNAAAGCRLARAARTLPCVAHMAFRCLPFFWDGWIAAVNKTHTARFGFAPRRAVLPARRDIMLVLTYPHFRLPCAFAAPSFAAARLLQFVWVWFTFAPTSGCHVYHSARHTASRRNLGSSPLPATNLARLFCGYTAALRAARAAQRARLRTLCFGFHVTRRGSAPRAYAHTTLAPSPVSPGSGFFAHVATTAHARILLLPHARWPAT